MVEEARNENLCAPCLQPLWPLLTLSRVKRRYMEQEHVNPLHNRMIQYDVHTFFYFRIEALCSMSSAFVVIFQNFRSPGVHIVQNYTTSTAIFNFM